jgi:hypothetical protein
MKMLKLSADRWTNLGWCTYYTLEMRTLCRCSLGLNPEAWHGKSDARQLAQGLPLSQRIYSHVCKYSGDEILQKAIALPCAFGIGRTGPGQHAYR